MSEKGYHCALAGLETENGRSGSFIANLGRLSWCWVVLGGPPTVEFLLVCHADQIGMLGYEGCLQCLLSMSIGVRPGCREELLLYPLSHVDENMYLVRDDIIRASGLHSIEVLRQGRHPQLS